MSAEPIIGYRLFRLRQRDGEPLRLTSLWTADDGSSWPLGGVARARCLAAGGREHKAPHERCGCGLYALHDPITIGRIGGCAYGVVQLWGRAVIHGLGLRAEYARIVVLSFPPPAHPTNPYWPALATEHGIEVVNHDQVAEVAGAYGKSCPEARPEVWKGVEKNAVECRNTSRHVTYTVITTTGP